MATEITNAPGGQSMIDGAVRSAVPPTPITLTTTPKVTTPTTTPVAPVSTSPTKESLLGQLGTAQAMLDKLKAKDTTSASGITSSDAAPVKEEKKATDAIKNTAPSRDLKYLDDEIKRIESQSKIAESAINSGFDSLKNTQGDQQNKEVGQTSVGLAAAGGYLGYSGSGTGVMLSLTKSHRAEMQALEAKRQQAIADARAAAANKRFDVVKLKAQEIKDLDNETYARQEDYNKKVKEVADKETAEAKVLSNQDTIFKAIQAGSKTPEAIFKALGSKVDIETINSFLNGITPKKKDGDSFGYSKTEVASLLGSGLGQEDITALNDTVNELGYTDAVRKTLPASVRVVADKIYRGKTGAGGNGDEGVYINGKKISSVAQQVMDGFTKMDKLTPTVQQEVRDDLYSLGFASDNAPTWFTSDMYPDSSTTSIPGQNYGFTGLDAITGTDRTYTKSETQNKNRQWQTFTRTILNGDDATDSELDQVDSYISSNSDTTVKER